MLEKWIRTAAELLSAKGTLAMIARPQNLVEILTALQKPFGEIQVLPIHKNASSVANRIIVQAVKGSKTPLVVHQPFLIHNKNTYTKKTEKILRGQDEIKSLTTKTNRTKK